MAKIKNQNLQPCDVIFNHTDKPKDFLMCDKWRVNIYSKRYVEGIEGKYISGSYFVQFNSDDNALHIIR